MPARIELDERETRLRNLLLDVARFVDESGDVKEPLVLRWAGGWVRDKLLGLQSHDIDTAINAMTGYAFSMKLQEFMEAEQNVQKHALQPEDIGNLHKIAANPEKSKHLETTTIRLLALDVDFVNLRKETYADDSRNPQMEFGTALDDALRRDATINALFYNLHNGEVEDLTGGLADLDAHVIRTPLEPYQTFIDDPLRVLRLIRFASRFGFSIAPTTEASMAEPAIMEALKLKISRERVGVEIEKMLTDRNPRTALQLINRLGVYSTIFTDPSNQQVPQPPIDRWSVAYDCLEEMSQDESPSSLYNVLVREDQEKYLAWVLASLTPWTTQAIEPPYRGNGKRPLPFATLAAREGIKASNRICDVVTGAFRNYSEITSFMRIVESKGPAMNERDTLGMAIRRWDSAGGRWRLQVLLAIMADAIQSTETNYQDVFARWKLFLDHLQEMDLMDAPSLKPPLDGNELRKALEAPAGPWMMKALEICLAWQFRNPRETDPKGAVEEVKKHYDELGISALIEKQAQGNKKKKQKTK